LAVVIVYPTSYPFTSTSLRNMTKWRKQFASLLHIWHIVTVE
jgi:hypothetical protein